MDLFWTIGNYSRLLKFIWQLKISIYLFPKSKPLPNLRRMFTTWERTEYKERRLFVHKTPIEINCKETLILYMLIIIEAADLRIQ